MITDFGLTSNILSFLLYITLRREKIFDVIKMAYASLTKKNLPIYGIKNKDLREFTTTEKDLDKGISRIPL